ncbi:MAG: hypothetical protein WD472_03180 [Dehalococcoidia bacterium]
MTSSEVLDWLAEKQKELATFDQTTYRDDRWVRWHNEMRSTLRRVFGEDSHEVKGYYGASNWGRPIAGFNQGEIDAEMEARFSEILGVLRGWADALILEVERFGVGTDGNSSAPARYRWTSPLFWIETAFAVGRSWVGQNKLAAILFGIVTFAGSVASIIALVLVLA